MFCAVIFLTLILMFVKIKDIGFTNELETDRCGTTDARIWMLSSLATGSSMNLNLDIVNTQK